MSVNKLIATATAELGYIEKATNSQLDSKTANAGNNNWTKYARDLDNLPNFYNTKKNGYAWCDVFVDWCFVQTFGQKLAEALLCGVYYGAGCTSSANYYKTKKQWHTSNPQPGDQIFFSDSTGALVHTGLVVEVSGNNVITIEGNASSTAGVTANGGSVVKKTYALTFNRIAGYGRPDWSLVPASAPAPAPAPPTTLTRKIKDTQTRIGSTVVPSLEIDNVTYVPLRAIVAALQYKVTWNSQDGAGVVLE